MTALAVTIVGSAFISFCYLKSVITKVMIVMIVSNFSRIVFVSRFQAQPRYEFGVGTIRLVRFHNINVPVNLFNQTKISLVKQYSMDSKF